ncbi:hypothetical protein MTO96_028157 [Rhipicephalus appendiculatus]
MDQRMVVAKARSEYGFHLIFNEAFNACDKDFRIEFKNKCKKGSMVTVVCEILKDSFMEICYETLEDSNKYFYWRRDPVDSLLHVGNKHLEYDSHHRYDLNLSSTRIDAGHIYVMQLEWKSDDSIQFYLNGKSLVTDTVSGSMLKDCARLVPGTDTVEDTSKLMHSFIVYEVHHTSADQMTLTDVNHSYNLPALYVVGAGGILRFTGKCIMRENPTGEIHVSYDGRLAAQLKQLQQNQQMTVVVRIHADRMAISLIGAPHHPAKPVSATLTRNTT